MHILYSFTFRYFVNITVLCISDAFGACFLNDMLILFDMFFAFVVSVHTSIYLLVY